MTQAQDKEDEQWLSALAGRPDLDADPKVNRQAQALRRTLKTRSEMLESKVPQADAAQYQRLLFKIRQENLLVPSKTKLAHPEDNLSAASTWRGRRPLQSEDDYENRSVNIPIDRKNLRTASLTWRNPVLWGLAATVVLGVGVVIQMGGLYPQPDESNILRGGGQSTVLVVAEPEVRLAELLVGLRAAGEEPTIKREADGRIVLSVKGTEKVLEYLAGQRIEPTLAQGKVTIELRAVKSPK